MTVTIETKLHTSAGDFIAPMSYEEVIKEIQDKDGILTLTRYQVSNRAIRDEKGNQTLVDANTIITARLDTNKCPVLCYEEFHMTDVESKKKAK